MFSLIPEWLTDLQYSRAQLRRRHIEQIYLTAEYEALYADQLLVYLLFFRLAATTSRCKVTPSSDEILLFARFNKPDTH